jgi:hypothetical protein
MKIIYACLIISFLNASCSHYVDSNISKEQNSANRTGLIAYDHYDLFRYIPTYTLRADNEVSVPLSFEVRLPKKIRYYSGTNGSDFGFYYDSKQVVFIKTILKDSEIKERTYEPSDKELDNLIENQLMTSRGKFDIKEITASPKNKNIIIRRNGVLILLYNISKDDIDNYISLVSTFKLK